MKCIKCGAEVKSEFNMCPYCGNPVQMVPDYSVYDEDDINVLLEETKGVESKNNKAYIKEQKEKQERAKKRAMEKARLQKARNQKILIIGACVALVLVIVLAVSAVKMTNNSSYDYQMKQADAAMFKGDIENAEKYYLKALSLSSEDIKVRLELAELYIEKGDTDNALKYLNEVLAKDSSNLDMYKLFYKVYTSTGDDEAILELTKDITDSKILAIFSDYVVDAPEISHEGDTYGEALKLTIKAKKGTEAYYTLNGTDPKRNGIKYSDVIELLEEGEYTLKVVAKNTSGYYSEVISETYIISFEAPADPEINPDGGTYTTPTYVYIKVPTGCTAYYTWDKTDPTVESNVYNSPLLVPEGYNILSVIIINDNSGLQSSIYRGAFEYIKN